MDLGFDLYAMAKPKTREDCLLLANEIIAELRYIHYLLDLAIAKCEAARG